MKDKILVTYASRAGSTAGVAEAIGKALEPKGCVVDVLPMAEVKELASYKAAVVGSAIQDRQWLPEAMDFARQRKEELARLPVATFLVCMTLAMKNGESYRPFVSEFMAPVRTMLHPLAEGLFAGVLDIAKIPSAKKRFQFKISVLMGAWREGDHRDWGAIRNWAEGLPDLFLPPSS